MPRFSKTTKKHEKLSQVWNSAGIRLQISKYISISLTTEWCPCTFHDKENNSQHTRKQKDKKAPRFLTGFGVLDHNFSLKKWK